jgi:hypothetical protein
VSRFEHSIHHSAYDGLVESVHPQTVVVADRRALADAAVALVIAVPTSGSLSDRQPVSSRSQVGIRTG